MRNLLLLLVLVSTCRLTATELDEFTKGADLSIEQKAVLGVIQSSGIYLGALNQQNLKLLVSKKDEITNSLLSYRRSCETVNSYKSDNKIFIENVPSEYAEYGPKGTLGLIKKTHDTDGKRLSSTTAFFSRQNFSKQKTLLDNSLLGSLASNLTSNDTVQQIYSIRKRGGSYYMRGDWGVIDYYYTVSRDNFIDFITGKKTCEALEQGCSFVRNDQDAYIKAMQKEDKAACQLIDLFVSEVAKHISLIRNYHTNYYARNWQTARYLMNVALPFFVDKIGGRPNASLNIVSEGSEYITKLRGKLIEKNTGTGLDRIVDANSIEELSNKVDRMNLSQGQIADTFNKLFTK